MDKMYFPSCYTASNLSPSVSIPISARTYDEQAKPLKDVVRSKVSRSLFVPVRNVVRPVTFSTRSEQEQQDPNDVPGKTLCTICYFFFLEKLLLPELKTQAICLYLGPPCIYFCGHPCN